MRGLGSDNVDHRLRQRDFRDDSFAALFPGTELPVDRIQSAASVLLVGCHLRKELPLVALRVRELCRMGGQVAALNSMDYEQNFPLTESLVVAPSTLPAALARIAIACVGQVEVPKELRQWAELIPDSEDFARTAKMLSEVEGEVVVVLGQIAAQHREASVLRTIASWLAQQTGIRLAFLPEANGAAAWIAGCIPHRQANGEEVQEPGLNVSQMLSGQLSAYLLFGLEPTMDLAAAGSLVSVLSDACLLYTSDAADE